MSSVDANFLGNPIEIYNVPTYVPLTAVKLNISDIDAETAVKGINLISLQTLFPTMLLLVTMFLALLISTFMCLQAINGAAHVRLRTMKGVFFPEFFSVYISSMVIISLPMLIVLLLGNFLFRIPIIANGFAVLVIVFLLASVFTLIGMTLAYMIKKEATTLLVTTFLLVFFIFFSGYVLPIERMSFASSFLASIFPGKLALSSLNLILFYELGLMAAASFVGSLALWFVWMGSIAIVVKVMRRS